MMRNFIEVKKMRALMVPLRRFAEITTLHGIRDLFSTASKSVRILWAILLILTTGIMVYEVEQIIVTFIQEPVATNIRLQKMTRQKLADIITPYICLSDWMSDKKARKQYSVEQLYALDMFSNRETVLFVQEKLNQTRKRKIYHWLLYFQKQMLEKNATLESYYRPLMKNFSFLPPPNDKRFQHSFTIFTDSVCFPINLDAATDVVGVPIYRTELDIDFNDTVDFLYDAHTRREITLSFYHGADASYFSEIDRIALNFTVKSNAEQVNLRMHVKKIIRLSRRDLHCKEYYKEEAISKYPINYARQVCMQRCMDDKIYVPKYNCTFLKPRINMQKRLQNAIFKGQQPLCTSEKFFFSNVFTREEVQLVHHCQDKCETVIGFCTEWDFHNERIRWVPPRTCKNTGCLNLAMVAQPTLEVSEEIFLMSFETLLSNIGGQAGLWFGGSVLSIAQIFFCCLAYNGCTCCPCHRRLYNESVNFYKIAKKKRQPGRNDRADSNMNAPLNIVRNMNLHVGVAAEIYVNPAHKNFYAEV